VAHAVLDAKRLTMVNRTVVGWLHDAVYPNDSETQATIKIRSILKTPEVTKILMGEKLTTESLWAAQPWQIPAVHMYGRLAYKFEGTTDMINGNFMENLSELLNSATGDQRRRKTSASLPQGQGPRSLGIHVLHARQTPPQEQPGYPPR
jgi:hypothetical protein